MKLKNTLLLVAVIFTSIINAQTKWIFHKSHSGANHTLFAHAKNNFGPGMILINPRLSNPISEPPIPSSSISSIQLKYKIYNGKKYPVVKLDSALKIIKFLDVKDSLIGCDRDYTEYLKPGYILYDINSNKYCIYTTSNSGGFHLSINPESFDLLVHSKVTLISKEHIYSDSYKKIKIEYPYLLLRSRPASLEEGIVPRALKIETTPLKKVKVNPVFKKKKTDSIKEQKNIELPVLPVFPISTTTVRVYSVTPLYVFGFVLLLALGLGIRTVLRLKTLK